MSIEVHKRSFRDAFLLVFDTACLRVLSKPCGPSSGMLIVRLDGIGDFILWLPAARALREKYPRESITLVVDHSLADFAHSLSLFDEIIPVRRLRLARNLKYRYELLRRVRMRAFELALHPCFSRSLFFRDGEAIIRAAVANSKIGSRGQKVLLWQRAISGRWYDRLLFSSEAAMTETERNAEFMRELGLSDFSEGQHRRLLPHPFDGSRPNGTGTASGTGHLPNGAIKAGAYYVLVPGAGSFGRRWPPEHFASIAERIYEATGWTGIICGGPGEEKLESAIAALTSVPLQGLIGRTPLTSLIQLLAGAELLVSNETGAIHIAAAVSTPSVCITGGGHFGRFVPYTPNGEGDRLLPRVVSHSMPCFNCDWNCIYHPEKGKPYPCVAGISVDAVWKEVDRILGVRSTCLDVNFIDTGPFHSHVPNAT